MRARILARRLVPALLSIGLGCSASNQGGGGGQGGITGISRNGSAGAAAGGTLASGGSPTSSDGGRDQAGADSLGSDGYGGNAPAGGTTVGAAASAGASGAGGVTSTVGTSPWVGGTGATGGTSAAGGAGGTDCVYTGHVVYTLAKAASPTSAEQAAYDKITAAMDIAVGYYNCYTNIAKTLSVSYLPSVSTADGNINGSIRFGSQASMNRVTAMHEISHTVGIGTSSDWSSFVSNGKFTGAHALQALLAIPNRLSDTVGADKQHFWPYGLNYESEGSTTDDLIDHCIMVTAIRKDLGLQ